MKSINLRKIKVVIGMVTLLSSVSAWSTTSCEAVDPDSGVSSGIVIHIDWGKIVKTGAGHLPPYSIDQSQAATVTISTPTSQQTYETVVQKHGFTTRCYWQQQQSADIKGIAKINLVWRNFESCGFDLENQSTVILLSPDNEAKKYLLNCAPN